MKKSKKIFGMTDKTDKLMKKWERRKTWVENLKVFETASHQSQELAHFNEPSKLQVASL